jgi:hypothetical protein
MSSATPEPYAEENRARHNAGAHAKNLSVVTTGKPLFLSLSLSLSFCRSPVLYGYDFREDVIHRRGCRKSSSGRSDIRYSLAKRTIRMQWLFRPRFSRVRAHHCYVRVRCTCITVAQKPCTVRGRDKTYILSDKIQLRQERRNWTTACGLLLRRSRRLNLNNLNLVSL